MFDGAKTTKENWDALKRLAKLFLKKLQEENDWDFEDLKQHLELPDTLLFLQLAREAGFEIDPLTPAEQIKVLQAAQNTNSLEKIAIQLNVPLYKVEKFFQQASRYGMESYGKAPWPGVLNKFKSRQISKKGQFKYKGKTYCLGTVYANKECFIEEKDKQLLVYVSEHQLTISK